MKPERTEANWTQLVNDYSGSTLTQVNSPTVTT